MLAFAGDQLGRQDLSEVRSADLALYLRGAWLGEKYASEIRGKYLDARHADYEPRRFAWRNVLIYLFCGALAAMPTIPVVASLVPSSFYTDRYEDEPLPDGLPRYLPLAPLFGCSGAFLGLVFWWRSGRHLR